MTLAGPGLDRQPSRVGLEATPTTTGAAPPAHAHHSVADLPRRALPPAQLASEDDPTADSGAHEDAQEVGVRPPGAARVLAQGGHAHVVVQHHRRAAEGTRQLRAEGHHIDEPGDVRGPPHRAGLDVHLTRSSHPHRPQILRLGLGARQGVVERFGHGREHVGCARAGRGPSGLPHHLALTHGDGLDLRAAQVHAARHPRHGGESIGPGAHDGAGR